MNTDENRPAEKFIFVPKELRENGATLDIEDVRRLQASNAERFWIEGVPVSFSARLLRELEV